MAKSIWSAGDRAALLARFDKLKAEQRPLWGRMSPSQMVRHCALPIRSALGEIQVEPKSSPLRIWPMYKLVIYVLPWPKGVPTAREFLVTDEADLPASIADLKATVARLAARGENQQLQPHAAFGALSTKDWGALTHRHLHHHLTQFGL